MNIRLLLFFAFVGVLSASFAQRSPAGSELRNKMDRGIVLMTRGEYEEAQKEFLHVLDKTEKLPSEMAYYFGRNSYHLSKYKQSINWLNKYIRLKGTKGKYYEPAVKFLRYAEEEYMKMERRHTKQMITTLNTVAYDCGGLEKMICPVCHGTGVVIIEDPFRNIYKICPYSLGEGYLSCEEYNLFMRGELEAKIKAK